jgi:hypothetical protein
MYPFRPQTRDLQQLGEPGWQLLLQLLQGLTATSVYNLFDLGGQFLADAG